MADQRQCDRTAPHEYHGWQELALGTHGRWLFHVCPGVEEPTEALTEGSER